MERLVTARDITAAAAAIRPLASRTPLLGPFPAAGRTLWLKAEHLQVTGSFKIRGVANAVAPLVGTVDHVIAQSSGNHGRALGYVAAWHDLAATVVLPESAPALKVDAVRATGARVVIVPPGLREQTTVELAAESGATVVRSDDLHVIAGHGTVGAEIMADIAQADAVLVPVCNGGMLAGVAVAVKALSPRTRVIGVEPELAGDGAESLAVGARVRWPVERTYRTIADGLRAPVLGERAWAHIRRLVDEIVTVDEDAIQDAQSWLSTRCGVSAEPSGAVTTAAYLTRGDALPTGHVVAIVSGGNGLSRTHPSAVRIESAAGQQL